MRREERDKARMMIDRSMKTSTAAVQLYPIFVCRSASEPERRLCNLADKPQRSVFQPLRRFQFAGRRGAAWRGGACGVRAETLAKIDTAGRYCVHVRPRLRV